MNSQRHLACALLLTASVGCAKQYPAATLPSPVSDNFSSLTGALATTRARLDSTVLEIHRTSGDTSRSSAARSRQLKARAAALDSSYRADLAELLARVNASTAGVSAGSAHFPIERLPAPFVRAFADGTNWMLQSPLIHEIRKNSPYLVIVPRGFVTDFVSIPKPLQLLRGLLPTTERYGTAALIHDYLYWTQDCTREQADNIMAIAMMDAGVPLLERRIIHEGVKQFGQAGWDENRKARQAGLIRIVGPPHDQVPPAGTWAEYQLWLRTVAAKEGVGYRVPASVCAMADAERSSN
jgi:hypothetical protein